MNAPITIITVKVATLIKSPQELSTNTTLAISKYIDPITEVPINIFENHFRLKYPNEESEATANENKEYPIKLPKLNVLVVIIVLIMSVNKIKPNTPKKTNPHFLSKASGSINFSLNLFICPP